MATAILELLQWKASLSRHHNQESQTAIRQAESGSVVLENERAVVHEVMTLSFLEISRTIIQSKQEAEGSKMKKAEVNSFRPVFVGAGRCQGLRRRRNRRTLEISITTDL